VNGLGVRQRKMLVAMRAHGDGGWPAGWRLRHDDKTTLASLAARQLISSPGPDARLTSAGFLVAASLRGELA